MNIFKKKNELEKKMAFFADYQKIVKKHGFQFECVGMLTGKDNKTLPMQRTKQFSKELNQFLESRKAKFLFDFRIISLIPEIKKKDE